MIATIPPPEKIADTLRGGLGSDILMGGPGFDICFGMLFGDDQSYDCELLLP